jgi:hypothetical protein
MGDYILNVLKRSTRVAPLEVKPSIPLFFSSSSKAALNYDTLMPKLSKPWIEKASEGPSKAGWTKLLPHHPQHSDRSQPLGSGTISPNGVASPCSIIPSPPGSNLMKTGGLDAESGKKEYEGKPEIHVEMPQRLEAKRVPTDAFPYVKIESDSNTSSSSNAIEPSEEAESGALQTAIPTKSSGRSIEPPQGQSPVLAVEVLPRDVQKIGDSRVAIAEIVNTPPEGYEVPGSPLGELERPKIRPIAAPETFQEVKKERALRGPSVVPLPSQLRYRETLVVKEPKVPEVRIHIGTVEVRATFPPQEPTSVSTPRPKPQGFDDYRLIRSYLGWRI